MEELVFPDTSEALEERDSSGVECSPEEIFQSVRNQCAVEPAEGKAYEHCRCSACVSSVSVVVMKHKINRVLFWCLNHKSNTKAQKICEAAYKSPAIAAGFILGVAEPWKYAFGFCTANHHCHPHRQWHHQGGSRHVPEGQKHRVVPYGPQAQSGPRASNGQPQPQGIPYGQPHAQIVPYGDPQAQAGFRSSGLPQAPAGPPSLLSSRLQRLGADAGDSQQFNAQSEM